jgi:hypothetical protein
MKKVRTPAVRAASSTRDTFATMIRRLLDLLQDTDLHVVDDQCCPLRIADFFESLGDVEALDAFHGLVPASLGVRKEQRPGRVP